IVAKLFNIERCIINVHHTIIRRNSEIALLSDNVTEGCGFVTKLGSCCGNCINEGLKITNELEELKKKTTFSEKEIREWYAGFMHDCPDGELDKKTFTRIFKQFYLHDDNKADSFCNYVFEMFDEDGNKTMSFKEFLLAICPSTQGELKKRLELVFDMYNVSGDTDIDEEELASFIMIMYDLVGETNRTGDRDPNKLAMKIIGTLDKNAKILRERWKFWSGSVPADVSVRLHRLESLLSLNEDSRHQRSISTNVQHNTEWKKTSSKNHQIDISLNMSAIPLQQLSKIHSSQSFIAEIQHSSSINKYFIERIQPKHNIVIQGPDIRRIVVQKRRIHFWCCH
ncbi:unnamed protein product, partial [Rotaria sp. Silwood1]